MSPYVSYKQKSSMHIKVKQYYLKVISGIYSRVTFTAY